MSNMHRIYWFDQQIREGRYPNSSLLANHFEISQRQAQRDIEYMFISLRAPLVYMAKHRGYCYEDKAYALPHLYITEEEKQVLKFLAFRYRHFNYENAKEVNRIAHLLDCITEGQEFENSRRLPVFETDPRLIQNFHLLSSAIQRHCIVNIIYSARGEEAQLRIHPLRFVTRYSADYISAYCESQDAQRTFRLDEIRQVVVTDDRFEPTQADEQDWVESTPLRKKPFSAKVMLAHPIIGDSWNGYPIRTVQGLIYDIEFYDIETFLQHLLVSDWTRILSPKWLVERLQSRCTHVLERCNKRLEE